MDPILASYSQLLAINSMLVNKALDGLSDDELWQRPGDHSNPIYWLVGHMSWSRNALLKLLGGEFVAIPSARMFERGAEVAERATYPPFAEVVAGFKAVNAALRARMEAATDEELSATSARDFPVADKTLRGAVAFLTFHDAYHTGQIAYVRTWLGKGRLVG
ncbi:MAG: DinB family protein [Acidobacteria bacterium]|nr:DinB family protein [Acidobacteriota bacterium]